MGQVRIIGGSFRGRKLAVPDINGLRPTSDRVRETLFNWLQGDIAGAHCLDLFAGSGALGFEALSRYAQNVTFVEPDVVAYRNLIASGQMLDVTRDDEPAATGTEQGACFYNGSAQEAVEKWLASGSAPVYDIVFIDPPFQLACQWSILDKLETSLLADGALIYIEAPTHQVCPDPLPQSIELLREKRFGEVSARLLQYAKQS